ncbi:MAG: DUF4199 domain-containing protein [Bacteroidota bacterium]
MSIEYRYGIICGLGLCGWIMLEFAFGFHTTALEIGQYSGYFSFIVPAVVIYTALSEQKSKSNGTLAVKAGINVGFQIAILSAAIFTIFLFFYTNYINPGWIDAMIEWQRKKIILGGATDDEIERFVTQNRRINNALGQGVVTFISTTGIGVVLTLVELPIIKRLSVRKS